MNRVKKLGEARWHDGLENGYICRLGYHMTFKRMWVNNLLKYNMVSIKENWINWVRIGLKVVSQYNYIIAHVKSNKILIFSFSENDESDIEIPNPE